MVCVGGDLLHVGREAAFSSSTYFGRVQNKRNWAALSTKVGQSRSGNTIIVQTALWF